MLNFGSSLLGFMLIECALLSSKIFHKSFFFCPRICFHSYQPWSHSALSLRLHFYVSPSFSFCLPPSLIVSDHYQFCFSVLEYVYCIFTLSRYPHCPKGNRDFLRYNMNCSGENVTRRGIFHVVSRFPLHLMLYRGHLDYFLDHVLLSVSNLYSTVSLSLLLSYLYWISFTFVYIYISLYCVHYKIYITPSVE